MVLRLLNFITYYGFPAISDKSAIIFVAKLTVIQTIRFQFKNNLFQFKAKINRKLQKRSSFETICSYIEIALGRFSIISLSIINHTATKQHDNTINNVENQIDNEEKRKQQTSL